MICIILILIIIILEIERTKNNKIEDNKEDNKNENENNTNNTNTINYNESYVKKDYLLTPNELKFYKLLKRITDKLDLTIFTQVSLYEIINCKDYKEFNKIRSKSIDFVITERNCKIKLCLELDDYTHNKPKRIERDNFINNLFNDINIKLIRIPVQNFYNLEELEQKIKESL